MPRVPRPFIEGAGVAGGMMGRAELNNLFYLPTKRLKNRAHTVVNTRWGRLNRDNNRQTETPKFPSHCGEKALRA